MKMLDRVREMIDDGLVDEVIRPLMSGKEADVFLVMSGGELRCAKVYKEAKNRSFRQRADYQEGRQVRSSRATRAMVKGSRHGKAQLEEAWHNAEVDALYRLAAAGVRVPKPYRFDKGVLVMELVADAEGDPAPRLVDLDFTEAEARDLHARIVREVARMLCAGLIHGDLSEYNVLVDPDGPVIIDLPQAVNAAGNLGAKTLLLRDVANMAAFFGRFAPDLRGTDFGRELWHLYESGRLTPDSPLTGRFVKRAGKANVGEVLSEIAYARDEAIRRAGGPPPSASDDDGDRKRVGPRPRKRRRY